MDASNGSLLQLQGGELLRLRGVQLSVEQGLVWVTRAGDLDDHFLRDGDVMLLESGAAALASVDAPARLRIAPHAVGAEVPPRTRRRPAESMRPPIAWDIDERGPAAPRIP